MATNSNQPVHKRSARLQGIIDLVKEEIKAGKSSQEIDRTIEQYKLDKAERGDLMQETFDLQVIREKRIIARQNLMMKIVLGFFAAAFGVFIAVATWVEAGAIFYLSLALIIAGGIYGVQAFLKYREYQSF